LHSKFACGTPRLCGKQFECCCPKPTAKAPKYSYYYLFAEFLKFCFVLQICTTFSYFCWFTTNLYHTNPTRPVLTDEMEKTNFIFNFHFEIRTLPNLWHWPFLSETSLFCYCVIPETTNFHRASFISKRSNFPAVLLRILWNFNFCLFLQIRTPSSKQQLVVTWCRQYEYLRLHSVEYRIIIIWWTSRALEGNVSEICLKGLRKTTRKHIFLGVSRSKFERHTS
jgi:hypothetical protein